MSAWFNQMWAPVSMGALGWLGGWLHRALTIKSNQLQIKANLPPSIKSSLQDVVDLVVPQLANVAETEAQRVLTDVATKITPKVP